ncbi:hypothetical protein [Pantoea sp. At-9b]|jgi:hypothetical protein|nr:hypothetical protein [Pantoea sp. At-9b]
MTDRNDKHVKDGKDSEHGKLPAGNKGAGRNKDTSKQKGNK